MCHVAQLRPVATQFAKMCPKCATGQWGALTGHLRCPFKSPPATGHPGGRNGNARARCAGLHTPLGSCAARVRRRAESVAAPAADHGRVRDGWCCEHRCHAGGVCVARERCVCAMAHAARVEPAPALVQVPLIDFESILFDS